MEHKGIVAAVFILMIIVIGMFIFTYLQKNEIENISPQVTVPVLDDIKYPDITRIDAKHFFEDGTHTIVGEIVFPTPCDLLSWDTVILESFPEQVAISFSVVNYSEACAAVVTPQRFKISFDVSENASIRAKFLGRTVELNLIEATQSESPDNFELFIKG